MKFLDQPLWTTIRFDLAAAREIRVTTYNLSLNTLITLANQAPHAQIRLIFNRNTCTPWNGEAWKDFQDRFGGRVKIRRKTASPELHAKVLRVAGQCEFAIVGSSNLTKPGYGIGDDGMGNQEASIRVEDPSEIKAIDRWWNTLWDAIRDDYAHPSDDMNPYLQLEAQTTRTEVVQEPDDDPEETLQTAPDDLTSMQDRIGRNLKLPMLDDKLRDYQREILSKLDARWQEGTFREMIVLPVGAGKTLIAAEFIRRRLEEKRKPLRILWVAHTLELAEQVISPVLSQLSQTKEPYRTILWIGNARSIDVLEDLNKNESVIAFATVQSLIKLREKLPHGTKQFDFAVIDEAHHYGDGNKWRDQIERVWKFKQLLGLTATPERLDGRELPFGNDHDAGITFRSLVEQGLLACPEYESVKTNDLITGLGPFTRTKAINYFETQGIKYFDQPVRNRVIAQHLAQQQDLGPTLVFCATKDHADKLAEALKHEGVSPEQTRSIHSDNSLKYRGETLQWFRAGGKKRRILLNCKLYIEGFDMPDIHTIVLARPTLSPTYWMQMIGRGVRTTDSHNTFTIIEYVDKYEDPKWDALRASFYLLRDDGLDKWQKLYNSDLSALEHGRKRIAEWNRETQQLYKPILRKLARHSEAA